MFVNRPDAIQPLTFEKETRDAYKGFSVSNSGVVYFVERRIERHLIL